VWVNAFIWSDQWLGMYTNPRSLGGCPENPSVVIKELWFEAKDKDNDPRFKAMDKDLKSEDKDKDL